MQPEQITLQVDPNNDAIIVAEVYDRLLQDNNRTVYVGVNHASEARDTITLYRTFPTKSGNFKGVEKTAVKLTFDESVEGVDSTTTLTAPFIVDISISSPVGVLAANQKKAVMRAVSVLINDGVRDDLLQKQMV